MSSNPSPLSAIAWLYIDGNIIQNGVDGYSYDRQMCRLVKLNVTLNFQQLCDVICAKLSIDASLYGLKIMHRCLNPVTKMYGVAPILDDDDVELMFELVTSSGVKNSVVELYLERVLVDGFVDKGVDVDVDVDMDVQVPLNSSSEQTGLGCGELGRSEDLGVSTRLRKRKKNVKGGRNVGRRKKNVEVSECFGEGGGNVVRSGDLDKGDEFVEVSDDVGSGGTNKKMFYMQRVDNQGKRVSREGDKGGDGSIPLYSSFDGSYMVASLKEPVFTTIRDVTNVMDLEKGMVFVSRDDLADIVSQVHHRNQQEIKVMRADITHWTADCKQKASGCKWRLTAAKKKRHGFFEIMNISGSHTCMNPTITPKDANLQPTVTSEDANLNPIVPAEDANSHPTVTQEDSNSIHSNAEEVPITQVVDPSGSHICMNPTITPKDANLQPTVTPEDANLNPIITPDDATLSPTITPEDANLNPIVPPDDANSHPAVTREDSDSIHSNTEEVPITQVVDPSV